MNEKKIMMLQQKMSKHHNFKSEYLRLSRQAESEYNNYLDEHRRQIRRYYQSNYDIYMDNLFTTTLQRKQLDQLNELKKRKEDALIERASKQAQPEQHSDPEPRAPAPKRFWLRRVGGIMRDAFGPERS